MAFKSAGGAVLQIGAFSNPARVEDVAGLSLDERDFESLRRSDRGPARPWAIVSSTRGISSKSDTGCAASSLLRSVNPFSGGWLYLIEARRRTSGAEEPSC